LPKSPDAKRVFGRIKNTVHPMLLRNAIVDPVKNYQKSKNGRQTF